MEGSFQVEMVDSRGLQCGTREKLTPLEASQAVARKTINIITTSTISPSKLLVTVGNDSKATHEMGCDGCRCTNQELCLVFPP